MQNPLGSFGETFPFFKGWSLEDQTAFPEEHSIPTVLLAFAACRSQSAYFLGFDLPVQTVKVSEVVVLEHEPRMRDDMLRIHDALSEAHQLEVYRFFLTAVHRNSVIATRFDPSVMSSPERTAGMEVEFDEITHQMNEIVNDFALRSLETDKSVARLLATNFLWSVTWWVHTRRDVISFEFDINEDPFVLLLLGRQPDASERVSRDIYHQATIAELEYRAYATALRS